MIISVRTRRAAVLGDELTATFDVIRTLRASVPGVPSEMPLQAVRCVVEMLRHGGGLMPRALLGGFYTPARAGEILIEVGASVSTAAEIPTCASALGRPLVPGLPIEFARSVETGLLRSALPPGIVVVDRGAFDPVESSPLAFELAAELLAVTLGAMSAGRDVEDVVRAAVEAWP
ncbi:hypothetical protein IC607_14320 [Cellulomonas sp. JH27-2]|uniref:hypothetical protein n=1 Tax=Cellulomonas sp. JH27-2 TaxID=2774139 RepID=UPI00177C6365|nr:hypothetical protein [Cellulomonas sp. JH27-2]MBD8060142.1 hypothetical protein [Cellulomonas sp. JH27-2]